MIEKLLPHDTKRRYYYELGLIAVRIIINEGWGSFWFKFRQWIRYKYFPPKICKDILFINGCLLNHPFRYRVEHQIEQLEFNGFNCDHIWHQDLSLDKIKYYRGFIFFRCQVTPIVEEFISKAKYFNKKVFFDTDDLVIDEKYIENIEYLKTISKLEFDSYMDGVDRFRKTLQLCDCAITTTQVLARELKNYIGEVFVNRNVASERMVQLSQAALKRKDSRGHDDSKIYLGYLSGSITHNPDLKLILPVLKRILRENLAVRLFICGLIDIPSDLLEYKKQLIIKPFVYWEDLPEIISSLDINLTPLEQSVFNEAKSENKWTEAALVKVLTVASRVGAFADVIEDGITGLLCSTETEWYDKLSRAIKDKAYRSSMANNAYKKAMEQHITSYTGTPVTNFIKSKLTQNIGFVVPNTKLSGGTNVLIRHCNTLRKQGYDVTFVSMDVDDKNIITSEGEINVISLPKNGLVTYFEKLVASLWSTRAVVDSYARVGKKYHLVQSFETDFYLYGNSRRKSANMTYGDFPPNINYITVSRWCQGWLETRFGKTSKYAPNGIDLSIFKYVEREWDGKIRILIEGNSESYYKNVDESFRIIDSLDRDRFEVWYLSYKGKPKNWYQFDRFFHEVPYTEVVKIYQECHLLVKSSILEGFSYPPLEMMATGGIAIVATNAGNMEYLRNRENCLLYKPGNIEEAINLIHEVLENRKLRASLIKGGLKTAKSRSWENMIGDIIKLYE